MGLGVQEGLDQVDCFLLLLARDGRVERCFDPWLK